MLTKSKILYSITLFQIITIHSGCGSKYRQDKYKLKNNTPFTAPFPTLSDHFREYQNRSEHPENLILNEKLNESNGWIGSESSDPIIHGVTLLKRSTIKDAETSMYQSLILNKSASYRIGACFRSKSETHNGWVTLAINDSQRNQPIRIEYVDESIQRGQFRVKNSDTWICRYGLFKTGLSTFIELKVSLSNDFTGTLFLGGAFIEPVGQNPFINLGFNLNSFGWSQNEWKIEKRNIPALNQQKIRTKVATISTEKTRFLRQIGFVPSGRHQVKACLKANPKKGSLGEVAFYLKKRIILDPKKITFDVISMNHSKRQWTATKDQSWGCWSDSFSLQDESFIEIWIQSNTSFVGDFHVGLVEYIGEEIAK